MNGRMKKLSKKDLDSPMFTEQDFIEAQNPMKKEIIRLFIDEGITGKIFKERIIAYAIFEKEATTKKANERYQNMWNRLMNNETITWGTLTDLLFIVLEYNLNALTLHLSKADGTTRDSTVETITF